MDLINETERRFTKKLCDAMIPIMIEAFWEIWLEAKKESQGRQTTRVFQELLRGVKTWNSSISLKNSDAIAKAQPLFPKLLAAVFVIHVKILSSIRTDKKSKKICIKLPATDVFTQRCYEACAKDLYENPAIIVDSKSDEERQTALYSRFSKRIGEVIEDLVPTGDILDTYLPMPAQGEGLDMNEDEEEEDELEPAPEGEPEAEPEPNMEFGKTPNGVDSTVVVNSSLTPPVVPGVTPVDDSLFPDAPLRVEKTG